MIIIRARLSTNYRFTWGLFGTESRSKRRRYLSRKVRGETNQRSKLSARRTFCSNSISQGFDTVTCHSSNTRLTIFENDGEIGSSSLAATRIETIASSIKKGSFCSIFGLRSFRYLSAMLKALKAVSYLYFLWHCSSNIRMLMRRLNSD